MLPRLADLRLASLALLAPLVFHSIGISADKVSPEDVVAKWKRRESALQKACVSWRQSIFQRSAGPAAALKSAESGVPQQGRTAVDYPVSLTICGNKYRYETSGFRNGKHSVARAPYITAFDNTTRYTLFERTDECRATGIIDTMPSTHTAAKGSLLAPNMVFRPFGSGLFSGTSRPQVENRTLDIDGSPCISVIIPQTDASVRFRVWVTGQTLTPLRLECERRGALEALVTIRYADVSLPHTLTEWDYSLFSNGGIMESGSARKVTVDTDCDTPDSTFVIRYPEGVHVVDKRDGKEIHLSSKANGELVPRHERTDNSSTSTWVLMSFLAVATIVLVIAGRQSAYRRMSVMRL